VLGGGLIGLCCAYYLRRGGAEVVVLERARVGSGASRGNAGEVCPSMAEPLPAPGTVREALGTLFRSDAAFHVRFGALPRMAPFLLRFAANTRRRAYARGLRAMGPLGGRTFKLFDELAEEGIGRDVSDAGYLFCYRSAERAAEGREQMLRMVELGFASPSGPLLDADGLRELEPALGDGARAGFLQPGERWLDPSRFVDEIASALRAMAVPIHENAGVDRVEGSAGGVTVSTSSGVFRGDIAVIAAGSWSQELGRAVGLRLGMRPGKGYSFSVRPAAIPRRALYLSDAHIAVTPLDGGLRIAGTMEFDGSHDRFNPKRIQAMVAATGPYLRDVDWSQRRDEWVAPRPMTPDGLPLIGWVPGGERVIVATGHNMLGLTLAPSTGKAVADLVLTGDAGIDLTPFSPSRFDGASRS
jgi:D-amino-acid dehydrogenase